MTLRVNLKNIEKTIPAAALKSILPEVQAAHEAIFAKSGKGNDFLGWTDWPKTYDKDEVARIKKAAAKMQKDSGAVIVIGIGGSYLGARAAVEFLRSPSYNLLAKDTPKLFFAGNNLSAAYLDELLCMTEGLDISVVVISKSGTTTEPAVAFRIFKKIMEEKYGKVGAKGRIYAVTDKARGALKQLADEEGYESFVIPDDIGGRFSILTPVGLLPIAVCGIDIDALLQGSLDAMRAMAVYSEENPAVQYAAARNCLYRSGKTTELLACYEPSFRFVAEWWKQLYGESEGKDGKGIFPASVDFTADLHSMGQYIQEGERNLFETVVDIKDMGLDRTVEADPDNKDGLNFLAGKTLSYINKQAMLGTLLAHVDGGVPNIILELSKNDAYGFGYLVYFFFLACGISGYVLGVNPFDQPGVEAYKKNMFALLGKSGYEELSKTLKAKL